jgi:hypothetical protein
MSSTIPTPPSAETCVNCQLRLGRHYLGWRSLCDLCIEKVKFAGAIFTIVVGMFTILGATTDLLRFPWPADTTASDQPHVDDSTTQSKEETTTGRGKKVRKNAESDDSGPKTTTTDTSRTSDDDLDSSASSSAADASGPAKGDDEGPPIIGSAPDSTSNATITDTMIVKPLKAHAHSLRRLQLPRAPHPLSPRLAGKCAVLRVRIATSGLATAEIQDPGGLPPFLVERARVDATKKRWIPAIDANDQPVDDIVIVKYCW